MNANLALTQFFDDVMKEIKPYVTLYENDHLAKIQEIFSTKQLTPAKYEGFKAVLDFAVWITDDELQKRLQCKKIWVELPSDNSNLVDKIYDLRDVLNHEWLILVINSDASYRCYRPLIWSKIRGLKNLVEHI